MKVETLYKNFMGIGGPKNYGLTRRMVQIWLLCLVPQGRVRVHVSSKSGLNEQFIDYSNIAGIDFSVKVLDALTEVQKMAKPENWEVLRPYAEKLLNQPIPSTHDDAVISEYRAKLRTLFTLEKEGAARIGSKAKSLFEALNTTNPYQLELQQVVSLFASNIESGDDINLLLYGLHEAFGYEAFEKSTATMAEVDDLANRLKNYQALKQLLEYETELKTAHAYCNQISLGVDELQGIYRIKAEITNKLSYLQPYIDSDVKLKTELIGRFPPDPGETGTLGALIQEYTTVYAALHDSAINRLDTHRQNIRSLLGSDDLRTLQILEGISALQPAVSEGTIVELTKLIDEIFFCASPSRASVEKALSAGSAHGCGLTFENYADHLDYAELAVEKARTLLEDAINRRMEVFLNLSVRERLRQGASEPIIAQLLEYETLSKVRAYLVAAVLADASIVDTINRYLKRIAVKQVKVADFKPSTNTVEKNQIAAIA